jgi:putative Mn2+ efflux pump MntP
MGGLLLVSVSLGLSNFAATIGIGLSGVDARVRIKTALAFGFFEALMPIIGLVIGRTLAGPLASAGHYVGAALLILIGTYVVWRGLQVKDEDHSAVGGLALKQLVLTGFALSFDNLVVGFALAFYQVPIAVAAGVIAVVSVGMSLVGLELGQRLGARFEKWSEEVGGAVLIVVGIALGAGVFS